MRIDLHHICRIAVLEKSYPLQWSAHVPAAAAPQFLQDDPDFDYPEFRRAEEEESHRKEVARFKTGDGKEYSIIFQQDLESSEDPHTYVYFQYHDPTLGGEGRLDVTGTGDPGGVLGTVGAAIRLYHQKHDKEAAAHRFTFSAEVEESPARSRIYEKMVGRFLRGWKTKIYKSPFEWEFTIVSPKYQGLVRESHVVRNPA